jgi:PhnB protein
VLGGELNISTFGDLGAPVQEDEKQLVMHGDLIADNGLRLMAADTPSHMEFKGHEGFNISLSGDDEATLRGYWEKLSDGATIGMPLEKAPWGDIFGMLVDKFGVSWLVDVTGPGAPAGA